MGLFRPKYLIIAGSAYGATQIEKVYEKNKLFMNFDLDVAFSGCNVVIPNNSFIIVDPYMRELKDPVIRYRWYMPKGAKVEIDTQYCTFWDGIRKLKMFAGNQYDAVINACRLGEEGVAEFWYVLDEVGIKPSKVITLPMAGFLEEDIIKTLLMTLNNN